MGDALDILEVDRVEGPELTKDHFLGPNAMDPNKKKSGVKAPKRPEGMSREVFMLIRNNARMGSPLTPSDTTLGYSHVKAKLGLRKVRHWNWAPFENPGRTDGAIFYHWRRQGEENLEYPFSRFDKRINVERFTEAEYCRHLASDTWTYLETLHLMELCERFDMRFFVVHDRYDRDTYPGRSLEDLKERYYEVVNILHKVRTPAAEPPKPGTPAPAESPAPAVTSPVPSPAPVASPAPVPPGSAAPSTPLSTTEATSAPGENAAPKLEYNAYGVGFVFDAETERKRKLQLNRLLAREQEEIDEEAALVAEMRKLVVKKREQKKKLKEIMGSSREEKTAFKKKLASATPRRISTSSAATPDIPLTTILKDQAGTSAGFTLKFPEKSRVYSALSRTKAPMNDSADSRKMKAQLEKLDQYLLEMGVGPLVYGSERHCEKLNKLRTSLATWFDVKQNLVGSTMELKTIYDKLTEIRKETGRGPLEIPPYLIDPVAVLEPEPDSDDEGRPRSESDGPRTISEIIHLDESPGAPTRKRKAALEQGNVLKKLKIR